MGLLDFDAAVHASSAVICQITKLSAGSCHLDLITVQGKAGVLLMTPYIGVQAGLQYSQWKANTAHGSTFMLPIA